MIADGENNPREKAPQAEGRDVLLEEHRALRVDLSRLRRAAEKILAGTPSGVDELCFRIASFESRFRDHLLREEAILERELGRIGTSGLIRLVRLRAEHGHQREWVASIRIGATRRVSVREMACRTRILCDVLEADMDLEERDLFNASFLNHRRP